MSEEEDYEGDEYTYTASFLFSENDYVGSEGGLDVSSSCCQSNGMIRVTTFEKEIELLSKPFSAENLHKDLVNRQNIIEKYMGSMAQCRGKNGVKLRESGALRNLLILLRIIIDNHIHSLQEETDECVVLLIIFALGALRDLACGDAKNRLEIGEMLIFADDVPKVREHGLEIIAFFIERYHVMSWGDILSLPDKPDRSVIYNDGFISTAQGKLELKMLTSAAGVIRNVTHSTRSNCEKLHSLGLTDLLIWRLRHASKISEVENESKLTTTQRLPDSSRPWREASFRIASSLINIAEKVGDCASKCADDDELIYILLESWGGVAIYKERSVGRFPVLHVGLIAILNERMNRYSTGNKLEALINTLLHRESLRKKSAQDREQKRRAAMKSEKSEK